MDRRFAVHAGAVASQALSGRAGHLRIAMAAVLAAVSLAGAARSADARPKRRDAKAAFDRGIAAYQKGNYQGASDELAKSFELERDVDTLYAWAQAERKLDRCDKAIELYQQLLASNLQAANRTAVEDKLAECRTIIAQQPPVAAPPPSQPVAPPAGSSPAAPAPAAPAAPVPSGPAVIPPSAPVVAAATPIDAPPETPPAEPRPSYVPYKDPIALGLIGAGIVAAGVGAGFLAAAHSASNDASKATTYPALLDADNKVDQRNKIGGGGLIAGGVLVAGGVGWILWKHHESGEQRTVTGWLAPGGGGGLVISGPF
jgi:tetratricopeptide (TPR) repeat protein